AAEPNGDALVAWWVGGSGAFVRQVQPDGTLGTAEPAADASAAGPIALSVDGSNVATLAYTEPDSTHNNFMLWARRLQNGAPTGSPIQISTNNKENVEQLSTATNPAGDTVLAWGYSNTVDNSFPDAWARRVRRLGADGTLGTEHDLGGLQAGSADYVSTAITPAGDAYVAWVQIPLAGGQEGDLDVAKLDTSDSLSSLGTLDEFAEDFEAEPWLVSDPAGNLTAVWASQNQTSFEDRLVSRRISSSGTVDLPMSSAPDGLSPSGGGFNGEWSLVERSDGKAQVVWYDDTDSPDMKSAIIDPASGPAAAQTVGSTTDDVVDLSAAPDAAGDVFLVYSHTHDFANYELDGAFYDATDPTIGNFVVPGSVTAGDEMVVGAAANDRSGVHSYSWDFGDGGNATGPIADHTYAGQGTYTVTLTVTDTAGNTTTKARQLMVRGTANAGSTARAGSLNARLTRLHRSFHLGRSRTLVLHLPAQSVDAFGSVLVRANAGHAARLMTLGKREFPVFRGKPVKLRVKLSARTVKLARRHHRRLKASLRLALTGFNGKSAGHTYRVTIRTGR
ncbi:MAG TPA: PKD domain-containing protein, partial [Solirubrobacteraceae bacterium]|nr:PKD domain-containing protein [Solirubrobacteraceae bacterium]